jgi:hypothetical protein
MMNAARRRFAIHGILAALPLCLLWPTLRHLIESQMTLHMLIEFPVLFIAGWAARRPLGTSDFCIRIRLALAALDWGGLTGALVVSCVALFWMIPAALDASLLTPPMAALKYASWLTAGFLMADSWRRMAPELVLFFAGNLAWMSATAGMLYMDTSQRLCANYLIDEQHTTGVGLIVLAFVLGAMALRQMMRLGGTPSTPPVRRPTAAEPPSAAR